MNDSIRNDSVLKEFSYNENDYANQHPEELYSKDEFEVVAIPVSEFISEYRTNRHQGINEKIAQDYANDAVEIIAAKYFYIVWDSNEVERGNHRHRGFELALQQGIIDGDEVVYVITKPTPKTKAERELAVFRDNKTFSKANTELAFTSSHRNSQRAYGPVYKLITDACPNITATKRMTLTRNLVSYVEQYGIESLDHMYGSDYYKARQHPIAKANRWDTVYIGINLKRGTKNFRILADKILVGLRFIEAIANDPEILKAKMLGQFSGHMYILLAAACRDELEGNLNSKRSKKITLDSVINKFSKSPYRKKVIAIIDGWNNSPSSQETAFFNLVE